MVLLDSSASLFLKLKMASEITFTHCRRSDSEEVLNVTIVPPPPFCLGKKSLPNDDEEEEDGSNNGALDRLRKANLQFCVTTRK